jgi:D-sedoheptulose 7-phosphate isomerase
VSFKEIIKEEMEESIAAKQRLVMVCLDAIAAAAEMIVDSISHGGRIYLCGNGGSAADSEHIACELIGRLRKKRIAVPAYSLASNVPVLTALSNDYGYENVFAKQIEVHGLKDDLVIAISTSGESENVVKAAEAAQKKSMRVIAMTGKRENTLAGMADVAIMVPSDDTPRIQEGHMLIGHVLASVIEGAVNP